MASSVVELVNRLDVTEIAACTVAGGIVSYTIHLAGASLWQRFAADGHATGRSRILDKLEKGVEGLICERVRYGHERGGIR